MIASIDRFHDGMRVCVRIDDGVCSEEFDVEQGLRQGRILSPFFFNISFTAVLLVTLQRFCEDSNILADFVHIREQPARVGPETAME